MFRYVNKYRLYSEEFCIAVKFNHPELDKFLEGVQIPKVRDSYGRSLLHLAAGLGNYNITKRFLACDCDVEARDVAGNTPLITSAFFSHYDVTRLLFYKGADFLKTNNYGRTAMSYINQYCGKECGAAYVKLMLDSKKLTPDQLTALETYSGTASEFRRIMKNGQRKLTMNDDLCEVGQTRWLDNLQEAELIVMYGESCDTFMTLNTRPLMTSCPPSHIASAFLHTADPVSTIFFGTDNLDAVDPVLRRTTLHVAVESLNAVAVELILIEGTVSPNRLDARENTALQLLCSQILYGYSVSMDVCYELPQARIARLLTTFCDTRIDLTTLIINAVFKESFLNKVNMKTPTKQNIWFTMNFAGAVLEYLALLEHTGEIIRRKNEIFAQVREAERYWNQCLEELEVMTSHELLKNLTVYDLLQLSVKEMIYFSNNALLIFNKVTSLKSTYPLYYNSIKLKVVIMVEMRKRVNAAAEALKTIMPNTNFLPALGIARHLDLSTLHTLHSIPVQGVNFDEDEDS